MVCYFSTDAPQPNILPVAVGVTVGVVILILITIAVIIIVVSAIVCAARKKSSRVIQYRFNVLKTEK